MEVTKLLLRYFLFVLLTAACAKTKTVDTVFTNQKIGSIRCPSEEVHNNQFIVKYEDGHVEIHKSHGIESFKANYIKNNLDLIKSVEYDSKIHLLENSDFEIKTELSSTSTSAAIDWGAQMSHAPSVWNQGVLGDGIKVAVIDQAVDFTHPNLKNQLALNNSEISGISHQDDDKNGYVDDYFGWDFINNVPAQVITDSTQYHGTHVAGIIAGEASNSGFSGIAPKAKIIPATFIDSTHGSTGAAILAIRYAVQRGAKVINASWGGSGCSQLLQEEISQLESSNVLFVAAAGNSGSDYDRGGAFEYPAVFNLPAMISVAASDTLDFLASFSNRSFYLVHIAAPGESIYSTVPQISNSSGFGEISGTSMAAPYISGAAALLWSAKPQANVQQIKEALLKSVDPRPIKVSSQGRLNISQALEEIRRIVP